MRGAALLAGVVLALAAVTARAEDEALPGGSGLNFSGVPTPQEIYAQQKACESRKPPRKGSGTISESTYKRMERIIDAISKGQYADSEQKLMELQDSARSDYEKAIILQTLGFVYASQGNKQAQAIKSFEQAIATNALPQQAHEGMMFNVAQLYMADGKTDKAAEKLNEYLAESCNPQPEAHILLASAYADKKQFREALKQVDLALVKSKTLKEPWLQLKLALHYELKEYPKCAEVLLYLVAIVPTKKDYWKQLSGILFEIKRDPDALAVLALAERSGFVTEENEYRNLANMYMYMQIPLKAAQLLERGFDQKKIEPTEKNLESVANAWLMAREYEKAEAAMKKAAAVSDKGDLYMRLGQIQIEEENWKGALDSLQKAQAKGGLKEPGQAAFLAGVCAVQLKQWKTADAALRVAMQHEKTAKLAAEWMNNLQQEQAYQAQTAAASGEDEEQKEEKEQKAPAPAPATPATAPAAPAAPKPPAPPAGNKH